MLILLYIHFILNGRSTSIILHVVFGNIYVHINAIPNHFKCSNILVLQYLFYGNIALPHLSSHSYICVENWVNLKTCEILSEQVVQFNYQ